MPTRMAFQIFTTSDHTSLHVHDEGVAFVRFAGWRTMNKSFNDDAQAMNSEFKITRNVVAIRRNRLKDPGPPGLAAVVGFIRVPDGIQGTLVTLNKGLVGEAYVSVFFPSLTQVWEQGIVGADRRMHRDLPVFAYPPGQDVPLEIKPWRKKNHFGSIP